MNIHGTLEPDDGQWSFVRGVGTVRSGPRGRRFWAQYEEQRRPLSLSDSSTCNGKYSSESDHGITSAASRTLTCQSTSGGHVGDDEGDPIKLEDDSDTALSEQGNYMNTLSGIFGDHHRNQGSSNASRSWSGTDDSVWRDDRRDTSGSNRSLRTRVKREHGADRQDNMGIRRRRASFGSPPPSPPPPPPPIYRPPLPPSGCMCPIGFLCKPKDDLLTDCRTLTAYFEKWRGVGPQVELDELPPAAPGPLAPLAQLNDLVRLLREVDTQPLETQRYDLIRKWILAMRQQDVSDELLAQSQVIGRLDAFLDEGHEPTRTAKRFPPDITEDLTYLFRKWDWGDLSMAASRGLAQGPRGGITVDPDWPWKRDSNFFGDGHLVNGQTWLKRVEMIRDGCHGRHQHGVHGNVKDGAMAIVMGLHIPGKYYADVDCADRIWYLGTARKPEADDQPSNLKDTDEERIQYADVQPRPSTRILQIKILGPTSTDAISDDIVGSYETQRPVRVIRSAKAASSCVGRPDEGYRYDRLYIVRGFTCLKAKQAIYQFEMERLHAQGPLRGFPPWPMWPQDMLHGRQAGAGNTRHLR